MKGSSVMSVERKIKSVQTQMFPGDQVETWVVGGEYAPGLAGTGHITEIIRGSGGYTIVRDGGGSRFFTEQYVVPDSAQYFEISKIEVMESSSEESGPCVVPWRVGEPFFPGHPDLGTVTAITLQPSGAVFVQNGLGGGVLYGANTVVPDSIEYA